MGVSSFRASGGKGSRRTGSAVLWLAFAIVGAPRSITAEGGVLPAAEAIRRANAEAEASLRVGEPQAAESWYRTVLYEGWLLIAALEVAASDLEAAEAALVEASTSVVDNHRALRSLALVHLRSGDGRRSIELLRGLLARDPGDLAARTLLARALVATGEVGEGVEELLDAHRVAPDDPEIAFTLATGLLRLGRNEQAETVLAEVLERRPGAATLVLIGRTYRDFGDFERARSALQRALELDPQVPRAHYYLGSLEFLDEGNRRLPQAIAELRAELRSHPGHFPSRLYLGRALVESRRYAEALPLLEAVVEEAPSRFEALGDLGRCLLGLGRPQDAAEVLHRALETIEEQVTSDRALSQLHYQLAVAHRRMGAEEEAASHFAASKEHSSRMIAEEREDHRRFRGAPSDRDDDPEPLGPPLAATALEGVAVETRQELRRQVDETLARAYLNLGVMQLQAQRFDRAAGLFEAAAGAQPDFPGLHYSWAVALFNASRFEEAIAPLSRAAEEDPSNPLVHRMLAFSHLHTGAYEKAAEGLAADPDLDRDRSLQLALGKALVGAGRTTEARSIFDRLLAQHADWPELNVLLGQAHAADGDYEEAIRSLRRALELDPQVAEANAALGVLYLRQGRLAEAAAALGAELAVRPEDARSRFHLATVLDLDRRTEEAVALLRDLLAAEPRHADARYLLGKILLARGEAARATEELEAAARLAPEETTIRYQLAQAYRRQGKTDLARRQLEIYRDLKRKARESGS